MKLLLTSTASLLFVAATALGHGSMADPISRTYQGFLENPQTPQSNAVLAAISVGGTQAFYDWNEVSRNILDYNYQAVIPDGQIPSAGRTKYAGLNLTRTDWPATMVVAGPRVCRFYTTTPHDPSFFKAYMTSDSLRELQRHVIVRAACLAVARFATLVARSRQSRRLRAWNLSQVRPF